MITVQEKAPEENLSEFMLTAGRVFRDARGDMTIGETRRRVKVAFGNVYRLRSIGDIEKFENGRGVLPIWELVLYLYILRVPAGEYFRTVSRIGVTNPSRIELSRHLPGLDPSDYFHGFRRAVGANLRRHRHMARIDQIGLKQKVQARFPGLRIPSPQILSRFESGRGSFSVRVLLCYLHELGVSPAPFIDEAFQMAGMTLTDRQIAHPGQERSVG